MRLATVGGVAMIVVSLPVWAASPAEALAQGRSKIASGDCQGAIAVLQGAIPDAAALTVEKTRADALGAFHFFSALAFTNCNLPLKAREEIREFLRLHPGHSALDAKQYPPEFIALFDVVQRAAGEAAGPTAFSHHYPDYDGYMQFAKEREPLVRWGASPEFQLLADEVERGKWATLQDDDARARFVENFWSRRDGVRDEISRRIAYTDRLWGDEYYRGSLSDRGRVFVLLGVPARVYAKPLTRGDGAFIPSRSPIAIDGILERWVYFKDQLPASIRAPTVEFRFISQAGYGDHVMQKEFWPMKALAEARRNAAPEPE